VTAVRDLWSKNSQAER